MVSYSELDAMLAQLKGAVVDEWQASPEGDGISLYFNDGRCLVIQGEPLTFGILKFGYRQ